MKPHPLPLAALALLLAATAPAQTAKPFEPVAAPTPAQPAAPAPVASGSESRPATTTPTAAAEATPAAKPTPTPSPSPSGKPGILLNFQNASLADVLNYLSEAAGFIVVQEAQPVGTVTIMSKQPMTADEAVDLLNSVLIEKGYTALRNGRILKIVNRADAQKKDLPVMAGSDPAQIPRKDQMVTQILPVRYLDVGKLVENLRPLLSVDSSISANESSNAILLADTQTNVHRIAEIIRALDTSVSSISTIQVFPLQYADSKSLATVLTQLFTTDSTSTGRGGQQGGRGGGFFPPWFGRGGGGAGAQQTAQSPAQQAATRIVAVADEQSNSVVVSAPEEAMTSITDIVRRLDTNIADVTEIRIFKLEHADSTELSNILNSIYADDSSSGTTGTARRNVQQPGAPAPAGRGAGVAASAGRSERSLLQTRVVAVPDPRTNSILVNAARDSMAQIASMVERLDARDTKKQHVYVHSLDNADPDNVAAILRGMFSNQGSSSSGAQPSSNRLNQRSASGASANITDAMNTSGRAGGR